MTTLKIKFNQLLMFIFKVFFPSKYQLYLKRKAKEEQKRIEEEKRQEEERKNIAKFAMVGGTEFINRYNKTKIDNIRGSITFYLKKKKTRRVIVVKGNSFEEVKNKYGEEYDFIEPMIKDVNDEWNYSGELVKGAYYE